ncbi:hypothetical protein, partial [Ureaplasma diversum]|uniref:hypothetical protein n=1 Tax=Ureaplasma diversum TaxID=42094 RepID=UPI0012DDE41F
MTKARKILISSLLLTTVISTTTITAASCSLLARKNQPIPISQPNPTPKNITNQQDTKTQTETRKTYDPNLFTFDKITFKIAKEDNDKDLKEQKFLDEIKAENRLEKYVPKKRDFYYKEIGFGLGQWF